MEMSRERRGEGPPTCPGEGGACATLQRYFTSDPTWQGSEGRRNQETCWVPPLPPASQTPVRTMVFAPHDDSHHRSLPFPSEPHAPGCPGARDVRGRLHGGPGRGVPGGGGGAGA